MCQILAKVLQHRQQLFVSASATPGSSSNRDIIIVIITFDELSILCKHQFIRILKESLSCLSNGDKSIGFDILEQKAHDKSLMNHSIPELDGMVFSRPEELKSVMMIRLDDRIHLSDEDI